MQQTQLVDPYYMKFNKAPRTYIRGTSRLDYILVDPALVPAIKRIGYMGSTEGNRSDHTMAFVDFDEKILFKGLINRPTEIHSREFMICQDDKKLKFTTLSRTQFIIHKIAERVMALAADFVETGATDNNIIRYAKLDTEIVELIKCAAKKAGRKKFGYMRSPDLVHAGQLLMLYKSLLSCKLRRQSLPASCIKSAERLKVDVSLFDSHTTKYYQQQVRKRRQELWEVQKDCENRRIFWLQQLAEDRTRAAGEQDWEKKMKNMKKTVEESQINRKLSAITKGTHSQLDRIQVPTGEWYYSEKESELYHYDHGVWEAYPRKEPNPNTYWTHHTLKVVPDDAVPVLVEKSTTQIEITDFPEVVEPMWRDVTDTEEIKHLLLARNKRHLQQADIEGGTSSTPLMKLVRSEHGLSKFNDSILNGTYTTTLETTPELIDWFEAIRKPAIPIVDTVVGIIPKNEYQEMFKNATEKTSSGGEIHYTLWKALAEQDDFAEFLCVMMSLPFMYGFANPRWSNEVDVMLEKKAGIQKIHLLRIIGLLEADLNTALKYFFAKKMMTNAETIGISDEQWGSRKNRSSIDAAMLKLLMFETARVKKATLAGTYYDLCANYDRIFRSISNLIAQRSGMDKNILRARALVIENMRRRVKTALGTSHESYGQEPNEPEVGGEVQGKDDVPSLWCVQSDTLLRAHKKGAHGMELQNPTGSRKIKRCNTQFVDDDDGWASAPSDSEFPTSETVRRMQQDAQRWNNINNIPGQTIAFHKCKWQILAWRVINGDLKVVHSTDDVLVLQDNKGGAAVIEYLPPDQPNKGLGYYLCPDGNQNHQYKHVYDAISDICNKITGAQLSERETRQALYQRLLPKLDYGLYASYFTKDQCIDLDKLINASFLPGLRVNRNTKRAIVHGPSKYGGLEMPDVYTRQTQHHIKYMLKQLRWNNTLANDILTALDNIQLASGFVLPILEATSADIDYIDNGWIIDLRKRLDDIGAKLWIEDARQPKLQREGDYSLMERFLSVKTTAKQRTQLRMVLHWLRVITIADLTDPTGQYIPGYKLTGDWQADSPFEWPKQPKPSKRAFAEFRKFLRNTICLEESAWQPTTNDLRITTALGQWHTGVQRNVIPTCCRTRDSIYHRDEETGVISVFNLKGNSGLFQHVGEVAEFPPESHPVDCRFVDGDKIWTSRKYRPKHPTIEETKAPGKILHDNLDRSNRFLKGASDGSLFRDKEVMTAGWILANDTEHMTAAVFVISTVSSLSSYRAELEGTFRLLKHIEYLGLQPDEIKHWCDNEGAVAATNTAKTHTPSDMLAPDADIILAILDHKRRTQTQSECVYVQAHQDTKKRKTKEEKLEEQRERQREKRERIREVDVGKGTHAPSPEPSPPSSPDSASNEPRRTSRLQLPGRELGSKDLSDEALMNVACDEYADQAAREHMECPEAPPDDILQPPYKGSKAMLKIGELWITSEYDKYIQFARTARPLQAYCRRRHGWSDKTFKLIDWKMIERIRRNQKWAVFVRSMKVMHGWLPIMHNLGKYKSIKQCPGCECPDETFMHLFQCPHALMREARNDALTKIEDICLSMSLKDAFTRAFISCVKHGMNNTPAPIPSHPHELATAIRHQNTIGTGKMLQGYLARSWCAAVKKTGRKEPLNAVKRLHVVLWEQLFQCIWDTRNHILKKTPNLYNAAEDSTLEAKLNWYRENRHTALAMSDRHIANKDEEEIRQMGRRTR